MDQDTRYAVANIYRQLKTIGLQVYRTEQRLLTLQSDLLKLVPDYKQMTNVDQLDRDIAEIGPTIAEFQTSIEVVVGRLTDAEDSEDLT